MMTTYQSGNPLETDGAVPMSEPITVTYLDLESLIDGCGLTEAQHAVVEMLMQGWSLQDIADVSHCEEKEVAGALTASVRMIVEENKRRWTRVYLTQT